MHMNEAGSLSVSISSGNARRCWKDRTQWPSGVRMIWGLVCAEPIAISEIL
eukprot:COSAG06_NODE_134_length_22423_cov_17.315445_14_plen_51_part_00